MTEENKENECPIEDKNMPIFPVGLLEPREDDPPKYPYDMDDMEERKTYKLWNIWLTWSHLLKNKDVMELLNLKEEDSEETKQLKWIAVSLLYRIGKILSSTNLLEEIKRRGAEPPFEPPTI